MRKIIVVIGVFTGLLTSGIARADRFGGFSADETHYLSGRDSICEPVAVTDKTSRAVPRCTDADAGRVAAGKFRRPAAERGSDAKYAAAARGTSLTVKALGGLGVGSGVEVVWNSTDPIARVVAVYSSPNGRLVAVEYEARVFGRVRTEVIAFALAGTKTAAARPPVEAGGSPAKSPNTSPSPPRTLPKEAEKALKQARKQAKRRRHGAALKSFRKVLAADADHPEARYGAARALAGLRKLPEAVAELERLAKSGREDAVVWLVEARFERAFAKLRGDRAFRLATGLDRQGAANPSLYERLVGFSSSWEQPETKCEKAQINLTLDRLARTYRLRITNRCGGYTDTTRLRGRWSLSGADKVLLTLPNQDRPDEGVGCVMKTCDDEDCLHCRVDRDLDFVVRPVRR